MPNKKINQLDTRTVPSLSDYLVVADPSTGYAYKELGSTFIDLAKATLVPYTGATASLNLGAYNLTATQIIKVGGTATQFLKADGSVDSTTYMNRAVYDTDADGIVDAAMAMRTIGRNATGATLYKGTVVYISGSTGALPNFVKAQANSEATSAGTFGVVYADIANNSNGYVVTIGTIDTLDTRTTATNPFTSVTLADGDTVYLDPNTAGYITNVKPSAPNHLVYVGKVTRTSPTQGTIVYRIQNGYELDEIHDVAITSKANNDVLVYESGSTLWKNKSIATILGYTPQAAITLTTTGSSGAATFISNTLNIPTVTLAGLGGAADSLVMHLAGSETATGYKTFSIGLQTTTGDNYLNYTSGATYIGYNAAPVGGYKLAVNGSAILNGSVIAQTVSSVNVLDIGSIRIADDGNGRYIQGYNGLIIKNSNTSYPNNYVQVANDVVLIRSNGFVNLAANGATGGFQFSTINTPSSTTLKFLRQRNDLAKSAIICSEDFTVATATPIHLYIYGGQETTASSMANLILQHDGTSDRGIVAIGTSTPNTSAKLQIDSTSKGLLLPRMTTAQKNAITTPATSLLLYDTDLAAFQYYSGSAWTGLGGGVTGSGTAGQVTYWTGSSAVGGTTTFVYQSGTGNLQLGTATTSGYRLDVNGTGASTGALRVTGGTTLIQGGGNTSATNALVVQNSDGYSLVTIRNDGVYSFNSFPSISGRIIMSAGQLNAVQINATGSIGNNSIAIGGATSNATSTANSSIAIGSGASSSAIDAIAIGDLAYATATNGIALGYKSGAVQANTFVAGAVWGSIEYPISNVFFGTGITRNSQGAGAGGSYTINGSGALGINFGGGDITIAGGKGTGTGTPGSIIFSTSTELTSGNTLQTLAERARITSVGLTIGQTSASALLDLAGSTTSRASLRIRYGTAPTTPNEGDIWQDGTNIKMYIGGTTKTFTLI